jgi:abequosyltransferase
MNRPRGIVADSAHTPPCEKLISICIPTYNRARCLGAALESLLPQLGPDAELLVYDTGSTDGTDQLMDGFMRRFPEIRYLSLGTKRGFDETALLLLEECRGEYVWFFGSDDVLREGAIDAIRRRIRASQARPSFLYLNHDVVDHAGKLLIPYNVRHGRDREFRDGRRCIAWLGLHLGYISACIFRRDPSFCAPDAREFVGSLWMGAHLNLRSLAKGGPALYLGQPLVRARRNPGNVYDYGEVFCRSASRVFWHARKLGIGWFTIYRGMNRTVRLFYLPFGLSQRCDHPDEFTLAFPSMLRIGWAYPWFWLLIVPVRLVPSRLARAVRDSLRGRRERRNSRLKPRWFRVEEGSACKE